MRSLLDEREPDADPISPREREYIELACDGASNQEIAQRLSVSIHTVKNTLTRVYTKLGIAGMGAWGGRVQLANLAPKLGLVRADPDRRLSLTVHIDIDLPEQQEAVQAALTTLVDTIRQTVDQMGSDRRDRSA